MSIGLAVIIYFVLGALFYGFLYRMRVVVLRAPVPASWSTAEREALAAFRNQSDEDGWSDSMVQTVMFVGGLVFMLPFWPILLVAFFLGLLLRRPDPVAKPWLKRGRLSPGLTGRLPE